MRATLQGIEFAVYPHGNLGRTGTHLTALSNANQNSSAISFFLFSPLSHWLAFSIALDCNCLAARRKKKPLISLRKRKGDQKMEGICIILSNISKGIAFLH